MVLGWIWTGQRNWVSGMNMNEMGYFSSLAWELCLCAWVGLGLVMSGVGVHRRRAWVGRTSQQRTWFGTCALAWDAMGVLGVGGQASDGYDDWGSVCVNEFESVEPCQRQPPYPRCWLLYEVFLSRYETLADSIPIAFHLFSQR
jgi:hypothetical protein